MTGELRELLRQTRSAIALERVRSRMREFGSPYCEWCGNDFEQTYFTGPQRFCSKTCNRAYHGRFSKQAST